MQFKVGDVVILKPYRENLSEVVASIIDIMKPNFGKSHTVSEIKKYTKGFVFMIEGDPNKFGYDVDWIDDGKITDNLEKTKIAIDKIQQRCREIYGNEMYERVYSVCAKSYKFEREETLTIDDKKELNEIWKHIKQSNDSVLDEIWKQGPDWAISIAMDKSDEWFYYNDIPTSETNSGISHWVHTIGIIENPEHELVLTRLITDEFENYVNNDLNLKEWNVRLIKKKI